jgi:hypothetical protein
VQHGLTQTTAEEIFKFLDMEANDDVISAKDVKDFVASRQLPQNN